MKTLEKTTGAAKKYNRFEPMKVLAHSESIRAIVAGIIPSPVQWVIYPSNVCGYKCGHCIMKREQADHRNTLSEAAMLKVHADAVKYGIKCVIFSGGGDPLLNRYTLATARRLKDAGVSVGINNQGYLLNDPTPFDFVRFSVDAASRETYQEIHGVDGWERVNKNISNLADLRAGGLKTEMGLAFLLTPKNYTETMAFCEWAQKFNPDFIHIRPAYLDADYIQKEYPGGGVDMKERIVPSLKELAREITARWDNVFFRVEKFDGFWTPKLYTKCRATPLIAVTSGDGAFLVCQDRGISRDEEYLRWGNYNTQSFRDIWWSEEHRRVLDGIDLDRCPRCVEASYNEIIEHVFVDDKIKVNLL